MSKKAQIWKWGKNVVPFARKVFPILSQDMSSDSNKLWGMI